MHGVGDSALLCRVALPRAGMRAEGAEVARPRRSLGAHTHRLLQLTVLALTVGVHLCGAPSPQVGWWWGVPQVGCARRRPYKLRTDPRTVPIPQRSECVWITYEMGCAARECARLLAAVGVHRDAEQPQPTGELLEAQHLSL